MQKSTRPAGEEAKFTSTNTGARPAAGPRAVLFFPPSRVCCLRPQGTLVVLLLSDEYTETKLIHLTTY